MNSRYTQGSDNLGKLRAFNIFIFGILLFGNQLRVRNLSK